MKAHNCYSRRLLFWLAISSMAGQLEADTATTLPVTGISNTVATLNGSVEISGPATTTWFEWGGSPFTNSNRTTPVPTNGITVVLSSPLAGLTPGLIYYSRMVASNATGIARGEAVPFGAPAISLVGDSFATNGDFAGYLNAGAKATFAPLAIATGHDYAVALKGDTTAVVWTYPGGVGYHGFAPGQSNIVAISGGVNFALALKSDGTVITETNSILVPIPAAATNVTAVASGGTFGMALKADHTVLTWGNAAATILKVPDDLTNIVAIAAGSDFALALRSNHTVAAWGYNGGGQLSVPAGLTNVASIAAAGTHAFAIKQDGTIVSWGSNYAGETNVPPGLSNVVAAAGNFVYSLALKSDGTIVTWGDPGNGDDAIPSSLSNVVAIAASDDNSLALRSDGSIVVWGSAFRTLSNAPPSVASFPYFVSGNLNTNVPGTNILTYTAATNLFGGVAAPVTRAVVVQAAPQLNNVFPAHGPTAGGITLALTGTNFSSSGTVLIGGKSATIPTNGWTSTNIQCTLPPGQGIDQPVIVIANGRASTSTLFNYDPPAVTDVSPTTGPTAGGGLITISGGNFGTSGSVSLGAATITNFVSYSNSVISFMLPPGLGGNLTVTVNVAGQSSGTSKFSYYAPAISDVSPSHGPTGGGISVNIRGTDFGTLGSGMVRFGNSAALAQIAFWSPTNITCILTAGQGLHQPVTVTVAGQASTGGTFDYDAPIITGINPSNGPTAGGSPITLTGTNFGMSGSITLAGFMVTNYLGWSHTQIIFALPPGEGSDLPVSVNVSNQISLPILFSYSPPSIQNLSPTHGPTLGGSIITLSGANFGLNPMVTIGGNPAVVKTNTHTQIQCTLPPGQGMDQSVIVTVAGQSSIAAKFDYDPPSIQSLSPTNGPTAGGTLMTLNGTNFGSNGTVRIGGLLATNISAWTQSQIVFHLPEGEGSNLPVVVSVTNQMSAAVHFTYDAPLIQNISPPHGPTGGGITLTLTGMNFGLHPMVTIGGQPAPVLTNSHTQIQCTLPPGQGTNRSVAIDVAGQPGNPVSFDYDPPLILGISPTNGPTAGGASITLTGTNFGAGGSVKVGNFTATNFLSWANSQIVFILPPGEGRDLAVVVNAGNQSSPAGHFSYDAPMIQNVSPATGPTAGGIIVTLTGANFGIVPAVFVGTQPAQVNTNTHNQIQFTLPPGQGSNLTVSVSVAGQTSNPGHFSYDLPLIQGVNPSSGPTAGGTLISITGANFGSPGSVTVGGAPANFSGASGLWSDTLIRCTTPPGTAVSALVQVTVSGQQSNPGFFSYTRPMLIISNLNGTVELRWPTNATDYLLEKSGVLMSNNWTQVLQPVVTNNGNLSTTLFPGETNAFFRLRRP